MTRQTPLASEERVFVGGFGPDAQMQFSPDAEVTLGPSAEVVGGTRDAGPQWTSVFGVAGVAFSSANASAAAAAVTDVPTTGQKLVVTDIVVSVDTAMRVDFKEETSGNVLLSVFMAANSLAQLTLRSKLKIPTANKRLMVQTSVSGAIRVTPFYFSEA